MCTEAKNSILAQNNIANGRRNPPKRSHSFTEHTPVSETAGLEYMLTSLGYYDDVSSYNSFGEEARGLIQAKAMEIVDRLDQEEPLIKNNDRPRSLTQDDMRERVTVGNALSPIVETREDFPSLLSDNASYGNPAR